jgi:hypothetical protein
MRRTHVVKDAMRLDHGQDICAPAGGAGHAQLRLQPRRT